MTGSAVRRVRAPRRPVALVAALLALLMAITAAGPAAAATPYSVGVQLMHWINAARQDRGLRPLRYDGRLAAIATERAATLADAGFLSHDYPGNIGVQLNAASIQWWRWGETLAWSNATFGTQSASYIYRGWRGSPSHWSLLMSSRFNYLGPGIAIRDANGATYASILLTESVDHTAPVPIMSSVTRSGTTVTWRYRAWEPPLQTHTAGLRNYDVEYRIDSGAFVRIRSGTTATAVRLYDRPHGHTYGLRIRARDYRGNVSGWSNELRIWVP